MWQCWQWNYSLHTTNSLCFSAYFCKDTFLNWVLFSCQTFPIFLTERATEHSFSTSFCSLFSVLCSFLLSSFLCSLFLNYSELCTLSSVLKKQNMHALLEQTWEYTSDMGVHLRHGSTPQTWEYTSDMGVYLRHESTPQT